MPPVVSKEVSLVQKENDELNARRMERVRPYMEMGGHVVTVARNAILAVLPRVIDTGDRIIDTTVMTGITTIAHTIESELRRLGTSLVERLVKIPVPVAQVEAKVITNESRLLIRDEVMSYFKTDLSLYVSVGISISETTFVNDFIIVRFPSMQLQAKFKGNCEFAWDARTTMSLDAPKTDAELLERYIEVQKITDGNDNTEVYQDLMAFPLWIHQGSVVLLSFNRATQRIEITSDTQQAVDTCWAFIRNDQSIWNKAKAEQLQRIKTLRTTGANAQDDKNKKVAVAQPAYLRLLLGDSFKLSEDGLTVVVSEGHTCSDELLTIKQTVHSVRLIPVKKTLGVYDIQELLKGNSKPISNVDHRMNFEWLVYDEKASLLSAVGRYQEQKFMASPYGVQRLGLMLSGVPGGGKTSMLFAISNLLGMDIALIKASKFSSEQELANAFAHAAKHNMIISLEEIDHLLESMRVRKVRTQPMQERVKQLTALLLQSGSMLTEATKKSLEAELSELVDARNNTAITPEFLLNYLDGTESPANRVMICTTNNPQNIPKELKRSGRFTMMLNMGYMKNACIRELAAKHLSASAELIAEINAMDFPEDCWTPALMLNVAHTVSIPAKYLEALRDRNEALRRTGAGNSLVDYMSSGKRKREGNDDKEDTDDDDAAGGQTVKKARTAVTAPSVVVAPAAVGPASYAASSPIDTSSDATMASHSTNTMEEDSEDSEDSGDEELEEAN
jgi:hypothetical protein